MQDNSQKQIHYYILIMKKTLLVLVIIICCKIPAFSQGALTYSSIIKIDSVDAKTLYQASKQWFVMNFPSPKKVIQSDDPNVNSITGRGSKEYSMNKFTYMAYDGFIEYTVQIQSRDGRIKVDITNITHTNLPGKARECSLGLILDKEKQFQGGLSSGVHNKVAENIKETMAIFSKEVCNSIESFIKSYKSEKSQDW